MKIFINRYHARNSYARDIRNGMEALGYKSLIISKKNSHYVHQDDHLVINWGDSKCPNYPNMLNRPHAIANATNKLASFKCLLNYNVCCAPIMLNKGAAIAYLQGGEDRVVFCRGKLSAARGAGIVVAKTVNDLIDCKLYTGGILDPNRIEYRCHVMMGKVIHTQQKKRRNGWRDDPTFSDTVRNYHHGWIFAIQNVHPSEATKQTSIDAVEAMGLDFGAVDIMQTPDGTGYVLEVNTAPGIDGSSPAKYCQAIAEYMEA
jgi:hypothetical protein